MQGRWVLPSRTSITYIIECAQWVGVPGGCWNAPLGARGRDHGSTLQDLILVREWCILQEVGWNQAPDATQLSRVETVLIHVTDDVDDIPLLEGQLHLHNTVFTTRLDRGCDPYNEGQLNLHNAACATRLDHGHDLLCNEGQLNLNNTACATRLDMGRTLQWRPAQPEQCGVCNKVRSWMSPPQ